MDNLLEEFFARGNSYWLTRFIILRLLGFVYAVAFLVAAQQLVPLVGEHGLTPASHFFERVPPPFFVLLPPRLSHPPAVFWFWHYRSRSGDLRLGRFRPLAHCPW